MIDTLSQFHLIRPLWLWGLIPCTLLLVFWWRRQRQHNWQKSIDADLLEHLISDARGSSSKPLIFSMALAWLLAVLALSGPAWDKLPQPVHKKEDALVVVLDLSLSMYAQDLKPSRIVRAKQKLIDILDQRNEGQTGLVVFAAEAFTVTPLTDDTETIKALVPSLEPLMMPRPGANIYAGIDRALQLLTDAGLNNGRLLYIGDGLRQKDLNNIKDSIEEGDFSVSVLAVGSPAGAPVPLGDQGFLKDGAGNIVVPKVDLGLLRQLAMQTGGHYHALTPGDQDVNHLLDEGSFEAEISAQEVDRDIDLWRDRGHWLLLLLIPVLALSFRKGWVLGCALLLSLPADSASAFEWQDLWQTPDQQAAAALSRGDAVIAADKFENPQWKAAAKYRAEDYAGAAEMLATIDSQDAHYNRGNALAKQQKLEPAIAAYEQALSLNPEHSDALANKNLLEQLLKQQEEKEQQQGEDSSQQNGSEQEDQQQQQGDQEQQQNDQQQGEQQDGQSESQQDDQQPSEQENQDSEQGDDGEQQQSAEQEQDENQDEKSAQQAEADQDSEQQGEPELTEQQRQAQSEEQQAVEQWLNRVPDNPSGLLERKFRYQYRQRQDQQAPREDIPLW